MNYCPPPPDKSPKIKFSPPRHQDTKEGNNEDFDSNIKDFLGVLVVKQVFVIGS
jgi:hypothetical protein